MGNPDNADGDISFSERKSQTECNLARNLPGILVQDFTAEHQVVLVNDNSQETGIVVITITVDKNGNVISANGPARGSTTTSANLLKKSKEAAEKMKRKGERKPKIYDTPGPEYLSEL
mgnify:CR=1 FL=1